VPREKQQPIGLKAYLQFTLPFDIAGFLTGAWIARSPEALTSFYEMLRSKNIIKIVPPALRGREGCASSYGSKILRKVRGLGSS
jgi:hypothetical protein